MVLITRVATTAVGAWTVFGLAKPGKSEAPAAQALLMPPANLMPMASGAAMAYGTATPRGLGASRTAFMMPMAAAEPSAAAAMGRDGRTIVVTTSEARPSGFAPVRATRARGVGSRFQPKPQSGPARKSFQ
jgi:hypothetical protein